MESVQIIQIALIVFIGVVITQIIDYNRVHRKRRKFEKKMQEIHREKNSKLS